MTIHSKDYKGIAEAYQVIHEQDWWDKEEEPKEAVPAPEDKNEEETEVKAQQAARQIPPEQTEQASDKTWTISEVYVPYVENKIAKINRRTEKLGTEPMKLTKVGETFDTIKYTEEGEEKERIVKSVQFKLEGKAPQLEGWELVATIEHLPGGNMIYKVPSIKLKKSLTEIFKNRPPQCDFCGTKRDRKETFLVRKLVNGVPTEGQCVGRTCLKDFLGGNDPTKYLAYAKSLTAMIGLLAELEAVGENANDPRASRGVRETRWLKPLSLLSWVAHFYYKNGWVSAAKSREQGGWSTTAQAMNEIRGTPDRLGFHRRLAPPERLETRDTELANNALNWVRNDLPTKVADLNKKIEDGTASQYERSGVDYYNNLITALSGQYINDKQASFAGSAVIAYLKETEWKNKQATAQAAQRSNEWVGEEGKRVKNLKLIFKGKSTYEGPYGTSWIVRFEDAAGNRLSWFSSHDVPYEPNQEVTVDATIKGHGVYPRGSQNKQTLLTRVKDAAADTAPEAPPVV